MRNKRIALFGVYFSGAHILAEVLHHLGVDMGTPFQEPDYIPLDLSRSLRRWWQEPLCQANEAPSNRVFLLRQWIESRRHQGWTGAHHPLLGLAPNDIKRAWGKDTRIAWVQRDLEYATELLHTKLGWKNAGEVQQRLESRLTAFFEKDSSLIFSRDELLTRQDDVIERLTSELGLQPTVDQLDAARAALGPPAPKKAVAIEPANASVANIIATVLWSDPSQDVMHTVESAKQVSEQIAIVATHDAPLPAAIQSLQRHQIGSDSRLDTAKNACREAAKQAAGEWILLLEAGEAVMVGKPDIQSRIAMVLDSPGVDVWMGLSHDGSYAKERIIRVNTESVWTAGVHELLDKVPDNQRDLLPGWRFVDAKKNADTQAKELRSCIERLSSFCPQNPRNGWAWYLLGEAYSKLGQHHAAVTAFDHCVNVRQETEISAWAAYMAARSRVELNLLEEAIESASHGLSIDANFPELAWMNAWCFFQLQDLRQSFLWSNVAITLGSHQGVGNHESRLHYRDPVAWFEGPFDMLHHLHLSAGNEAEAAAARQMIEAARNARLTT